MANEAEYQSISNGAEATIPPESTVTVQSESRSRWTEILQVTLRDNVLQCAVGLIFATALTSVVNSLVSDIVLPTTSLLLFMPRNFEENFVVVRKGRHFERLQGYNSRNQAIEDGAVILAYGAFVDQLVKFIGIGLVVYLVTNAYKDFSHGQFNRMLLRRLNGDELVSSLFKELPKDVEPQSSIVVTPNDTTKCALCGMGNSSKNLQKEVAPSSAKEFQNFLEVEIAKDKTFKRFFAPNDPFIKELAEKANAITQDKTTDLGKPENIKHLTQISLYAPIIYCDDSGSMRHEHRYENQIELVQRIAGIATKIVPEDMSGVELRFINNSFAERVTSTNIHEAMKLVPAKGTTNIGTNLRKKILEPFVYSKISQPLVAGKPFAFRRPLLVCIITDGVPDPEETNTLRDEIVFCKNELKKWNYDPTAVKFCINQIGTCNEAKQFLNGLRNEKSIEDVVYCTVGELDTEFAKLKENERALESWLLHVLAKPVMELEITD